MKGVIHITFTPGDDPSVCNIAVKQSLEDISPYALADAFAEIIAVILERSPGVPCLCNLVKYLALEKFKIREDAGAGDPAEAEEPAAENKEESPDE